MPTHLIGNFAKGGTRFLCGQKFVQRELAHDGLPTCPDCLRIDEEYTAAMGFTVENGALVDQDPPQPSAPPVSARDPRFDPLAGYRPKGMR